MRTKVVVILLLLGMLLGGTLVWAEGKYKTIEVYMDRINVIINGQKLTLTKDSIIYNGTVYLPLRDLSDSLGAQVTWNEQNRSVALDFIKDQSATAFQASQKGLYQYINLENNQIMSLMIESLQANQMEPMKDVIARYESLRLLAVSLKDTKLAQIFEKLSVSAELIRSGWISKNLDDYYLAWTIFNTNAGSLNVVLKEKLADKMIENGGVLQ